MVLDPIGWSALLKSSNLNETNNGEVSNDLTDHVSSMRTANHLSDEAGPMGSDILCTKVDDEKM